MANDLATPHHRDAIGDLEDFLQLMGDENNRFAGAHQVAQNAEEFHGFLRCQHTGRLIQDQDVGAAVENFYDLHSLLQPDRQITDAGVGVEGQAVTLR